MDVWTTQIEVILDLRRWYVYRHFNNGRSEVLWYFKKQRDAHLYARGYATAIGSPAKAKGRSLELVIKDRKGRIKIKDSFGHDPRGNG